MASLLSDASTRSSEKVERLAILGPCTALCKTSPRLPALHLHLGLKLWVVDRCIRAFCGLRNVTTPWGRLDSGTFGVGGWG